MGGPRRRRAPGRITLDACSPRPEARGRSGGRWRGLGYRSIAAVSRTCKPPRAPCTCSRSSRGIRATGDTHAPAARRTELLPILQLCPTRRRCPQHGVHGGPCAGFPPRVPQARLSGQVRGAGTRRRAGVDAVPPSDLPVRAAADGVCQAQLWGSLNPATLWPVQREDLGPRRGDDRRAGGRWRRLRWPGPPARFLQGALPGSEARHHRCAARHPRAPRARCPGGGSQLVIGLGDQNEHWGSRALSVRLNIGSGASLINCKAGLGPAAGPV